MRFNLVSNLAEDYDPVLILQYNTSIAVNLKKFLELNGHEVKLVKDHADEASEADNTIVISNWAMNRVNKEPAYREMLREASRDKLALWLDASFSGMETYYDKVLTVTPPNPGSDPKFKWVGYAADPDRFYSEQGETPMAFVDSYAYGWYGGKFDYIFDILKAVLDVQGVKVYQPVNQYNTGQRVPYDEFSEMFRKCHFSIVTQLGFWGLTNIETATSGALLVVHRDMDRPRTWPCKMNHVFWENQADLEDIFSRSVDVVANRTVALESSWDDVVMRIEEALQ